MSIFLNIIGSSSLIPEIILIAYLFVNTGKAIGHSLPSRICFFVCMLQPLSFEMQKQDEDIEENCFMHWPIKINEMVDRLG